MTGRVHSIQTLSGLDGPGLRCVVFLQGCPMRCRYCHNPDTWDFSAGQAMTAEEVVAAARRYRPYFGAAGGITLSGGEPLAQPAFAEAILSACKLEGLHTALDTSGCLFGEAAMPLLRRVDLLLLDIKHTDAGKYRDLTGGDLQRPLALLDYATAERIPTWIRQVIVPGWNDSLEDVRALAKLLAGRGNVRKVELLPLSTLAREKYRALGLPFPMAHAVPPSLETVKSLQREMDRLLA